MGSAIYNKWLFISGIIVSEKFKWSNHVKHITTPIQKLFYIVKSTNKC